MNPEPIAEDSVMDAIRFARLLAMSSLGGEDATRDRFVGRGVISESQRTALPEPRLFIPRAKRMENARKMTAMASA